MSTAISMSTFAPPSADDDANHNAAAPAEVEAEAGDEAAPQHVSLAIDGSGSQGNTQLLAVVESQPTLTAYVNDPTLRPTMDRLLLGAAQTLNVDLGGPEQYAMGDDDEKVGQPLGSSDGNPQPKQSPPGGDDSVMRRFGMWDGVVARCLLQIWGVILFTRLTYTFGVAGTGVMTLVILLSIAIVTVTTLSLSAITTNGEVKGGGVYFLLSRSLGPEYGATIGLLFAFANAVAIALYLVGFAEALIDNIRVFDPSFQLTAGGAWDEQVLALISLAGIFVLCLIGVDWVIKTQLGLLVLLSSSIVSVIIGALFVKDEAKGITGPSATNFADNWAPDWQGHNFFTVFAIFFPACTGIMAGVNISGEVKKPHKSIPNGTLLAVAVSAVVYLLLGWLTMSSAVRYVAGDASAGLIADKLIMTSFSLWPPLIYGGTYAATLSSAIASLVGAPRVVQALAVDGILPWLAPFAKGHGPKNEPWAGYTLSTLIALVFCLIGDLDTIAPLITCFFMVSYALINYACFAASHSRLPSWRPLFKYYNKWASLACSLVCVAIMFVISWVMSLVTLTLCFALFTYLERANIDINWGDSRAAARYLEARKAMLRLEHTAEHAKTFRPSFLVLTSRPVYGPVNRMIQFFQHAKGVMVHGHVIVLPDFDSLTSSELDAAYRQQRRFASGRLTSDSAAAAAMAPMMDNNKSTNSPKMSESSSRAAAASSDDSRNSEDTKSTVTTSMTTTASKRRIVIGDVALSGDTERMFDEGDHRRDKKRRVFHEAVVARSFRDGAKSLFQLSGMSTLRPNTVVLGWPTDWTREKGLAERYVSVVRDAMYWRKGVVVARNCHRVDHSRRAYDGTIDLWWIFDDGGLSLLLAHLLTRHPAWRRTRLRVMSVSSAGGGLSREQIQMARLLNQFRIDADVQFVDMKVDGHGNPRPSPAALKQRSQLLVNFVGEKRDVDDTTGKYRLSGRSKWHLAVADLVQQHSNDSQLVLMSLGVPNIHVPAAEWLALLTILSDIRPPTLFVRGNQRDVLSATDAATFV